MTEQKDVLCAECGEPMLKHEGMVAGDVRMANGQILKVVSNGYYECLKCDRKRGYKDGFINVAPNPLQALDRFPMTNPDQKDLSGKDWFETMEAAGKPIAMNRRSNHHLEQPQCGATNGGYFVWSGPLGSYRENISKSR
jgi:hypothetical protein